VGTLPISGDWDGDGLDNIGVFRPSTGEWRLYTPRITQVNQSVPTPIQQAIVVYGQAGETGNTINGAWVPGLRSGLGLYRGPEFSLERSSGSGGSAPIEPNAVEGADYAFTFGSYGDKPVAGRWQGQLPPNQTPSVTPTYNPSATLVPITPAPAIQKILMLLCKFADYPIPNHPYKTPVAPYDVAWFQQAMGSAAIPQVGHYWNQQSFTATSLSTDVYGWIAMGNHDSYVRVSGTSSYLDYGAAINDCVINAHNGSIVNFASYPSATSLAEDNRDGTVLVTAFNSELTPLGDASPLGIAGNTYRPLLLPITGLPNVVQYRTIFISKRQYPRQNFTVQRMSLSNGPFDKGQTISGACAKADELVFKVNGAALWVEQSPLRFRPSKLARVL
jgi:hypothetical protein